MGAGALGSSAEASAVAGPGGQAGKDEKGAIANYISSVLRQPGVGGSVGRSISSFYVHPCDQICNVTYKLVVPAKIWCILQRWELCRDRPQRPVETHIKICIHIIIRIISPSVFLA